jgi:hypothetical protein
MNIKMGLWIDHRQAILVRLYNYGEETSHIFSNLPKRVRFSGASHDRSEENPHDDFAEDVRDKRFETLLTHYYDEVIAQLTHAESILILGPGEAKLELQKQLASVELADRVVDVQAADKMTERQVAARVRQFYLEREDELRVK